VGIIIVSTATPDRWLPSTACDMQALLGASNAMAFDVSAACSGWLYALSMAEGYLAAGRADYALVVAAEKMSGDPRLDRPDHLRPLRGRVRGGGPQARRGAGEGIVSSFHRSDGNLADLLYRPGGRVRPAPDPPGPGERGSPDPRCPGRRSSRTPSGPWPRRRPGRWRAGLTGEDIDLMIPHQANIRIIESTAKYAGIPMEKVYVNVDRYGNMSSASIPVALDEALRGRARSSPG
jgi:3-oxoacyl-[acyl-carrier-protein] synthase-3